MGWAKRKEKLQENRLYLTRVLPLPLEKWLSFFKEPMLAATKLWNSCVWESREARKKEEPYPGEGKLKSRFKEHQAWKKLHSQSAQAVVEEYFEAVRSYIKHKKNGHVEMRPPQFKPKARLRTVTWKPQGFNYAERRVTLKLSKKLAAIGVPLPEEADVLSLPDGSVRRGFPTEVKVKAVYRGKKLVGLELHVTWDFGVIPVPSTGKAAAYDINSALVARATTDGERQLIVCREILALVQYRNKISAEFQETMSRLKEKSRRWKALNRAKAKRLKRIERRIKQMLNALTKLMAQLDESQGVSVSVLGDLTDLRRSSHTGDKNKKASQKINQMPYAQIRMQHAYKSLLRQVRPAEVSEKNSSRTCSRCGVRNKAYRVHRGLWRCKDCGAEMQADLNGSVNILKNYLFGECSEQVPFPLKPPEVYRWDFVKNRFVPVTYGQNVSPRAA